MISRPTRTLLRCSRALCIFIALFVAVVALFQVSIQPSYSATQHPSDTDISDTDISDADSSNANASIAAAAFLSRELAQSNDHFMTQWGATPEESSADIGLTIDAVLALDAAGIAQRQARESTAWIAANLNNYIGVDKESYAGAVAKAAFLAQTQKLDAHAFGGVDLIAKLQSLQLPNGRFADASAWGDYSNTFGQSWAILALERANENTALARSYLISQQCNDGGFRTTLDAETAPCASTVDATAMAIHALVASANTSGATADANIQSAVAYLLSQQKENGGFSASAIESENSNSTGLAASALSSAGSLAAHKQASAFLQKLQLACSVSTGIAGAVVYDTNVMAEYVAKGNDATAADKDRRSTTQSVLGLAGKSLATLSNDGAVDGTPVGCVSAPTTTTTALLAATSTTVVTSAVVSPTVPVSSESSAVTTTTPMYYGMQSADVAAATQNFQGRIARTGANLDAGLLFAPLLLIIGILLLSARRALRRQSPRT